MRRATKIILRIVTLFVSLPIWLFLMYSILSVSHVDRLVWFLFWVYVPTVFIVGVIDKLLELIPEKAGEK